MATLLCSLHLLLSAPAGRAALSVLVTFAAVAECLAEMRDKACVLAHSFRACVAGMVVLVENGPHRLIDSNAWLPRVAFMRHKVDKNVKITIFPLVVQAYKQFHNAVPSQPLPQQFLGDTQSLCGNFPSTLYFLVYKSLLNPGGSASWGHCNTSFQI